VIFVVWSVLVNTEEDYKRRKLLDGQRTKQCQFGH